MLKPTIKEKNGRYFAVLEIDKETALDYSRKLETHDFNIHVKDNRVRTNAQIKLFFAMLDEFVQFLFPDDKLSTNQKEELKEALYEEYASEKNINVSLSTSSLYDVRLFLEHTIKMYADKYNFVPKELEVRDEFTEKYVYACLVSGSCAVCGDKASVNKSISKKYIPLCDKHKELKRKQLVEEHHLIPIAISENTIKLLGD